MPAIAGFDLCAKGREIWIVADGPSCPLVPVGDQIVLAVNYGFRNVDGRPFGLVYLDERFRKGFEDPQPMEAVAANVFHSRHSGVLTIANGVTYEAKTHPQLRLVDGVYSGGFPDGRSSGCAALSLALGMGPALVRLFGYDYRVYSEDESLVLFGRDLTRAHASEANHRRLERSEEMAGVLRKKLGSFDRFLRGRIPILNHALHSNLNQFPRVPFPG